MGVVLKYYSPTHPLASSGLVTLSSTSASDTASTPTGDVAAANVQDAIAELSSEKMRATSLAGTEDLDTIIAAGVYRLGTSHTHMPTGGNYGQMLVMHGGGDTISQVIITYSTLIIWARTGNPTNVGGAGAWTTWGQIYPPVYQ